MTQVSYEMDEKETPPDTKEDLVSSTSTITDSCPDPSKEDLNRNINYGETTEVSLSHKKFDDPFISSGNESEVVGTTTPLHEAAHSGDAHKVLEFLEQGLDPCIKDERGKTPYMLANEKEVRNTFRRFMASNIDRWDWHAANVPSSLTKEMEESQAAKQVFIVLGLLLILHSFLFSWKYDFDRYYLNFLTTLIIDSPSVSSVQVLPF